MGFDKFGVKSFVSETKAEEFVTYLEQGKVMATQCKRCQQIIFPPRMDCGRCGLSEMDWVEIKEVGQLETFTTVMYGPAGFEKETPYTLAVVRFPVGIRVFGQMNKKIPIDEIKVGMDLKVVPLRLSQDRISYVFDKI